MHNIKLRVQKLLALAKDSNDEESHTAMLQARKLMLKYNIYDSDLLSDEIISKSIVNENIYRNKLLWWHRNLAQIIAKHFKCSYYRNPIESYHAEIRFVGLENDVKIAAIVYNFARASIHYNSKIFLERPEIKRKWKRKHQFKNDYINGYLAGLDSKFVKQNKSESLELLIIQDALVIDYFDSLSLENKSIVKPKSAGDPMAWKKGFKDGTLFESERKKIEA